MNILGEFSNDREEFILGPDKPLETEERIISQKNAVWDQLDKYIGIVHPDQKQAEMHINPPQYIIPLRPCMTGNTSGTSKSVHEELIASVELSLPRVVDKLLEINTEFGCVNKSQINERLLNFAKKSSLDTLKSLTPEELERRIEKILILESAISAFIDLTPEQKKILDEY